MKSLFTMSGNAIRKLFGSTPNFSGSAGTAVGKVSDNFTSVGNILIEGGVSEEYGQIALQKLHEAQLAVNFAIEHGWADGKGAKNY